MGHAEVGGWVDGSITLGAVGDHRAGPMRHGLGDNWGCIRQEVPDKDLDGDFTFTFNDGPRCPSGWRGWALEPILRPARDPRMV